MSNPNTPSTPTGDSVTNPAGGVRAAVEEITVADGKYTLQFDNGYLRCLRYGEPWRDHLTGDGMVLALMQRIQQLEAERANERAAVEKALAAWDVLNTGAPQSLSKFHDAMDALRTALHSETKGNTP